MEHSGLLPKLLAKHQRKHAKPEAADAATASQCAASSVFARACGNLEASWRQDRLLVRQGSRTVRALSLPDTIVDACFLSVDRDALPTSRKGKERQTKRTRYICVLLKHALRVYSLESAESREHALPFAAVRIQPVPAGLLIQSQHPTITSVDRPVGSSDASTCLFYFELSTASAVGLFQVKRLSQPTQRRLRLTEEPKPFARAEEALMRIANAENEDGPSVFATFEAGAGTLRLYQYQNCGQPPELAYVEAQLQGDLNALRMAKTYSAGEVRPAAEMEEDDDPVGERHHPRKSARLEHDRRARLYGPLSTEVQERHRRTSAAGPRSTRMSNAFDELQAAVGPSTTMADLADDFMRQRHSDALMEDSFAFEPASRPSLTRRFSSERRLHPRATLTTERPMQSRASSGPARRSSNPSHFDLSMMRQPTAAGDEDPPSDAPGVSEGCWSYAARLKEVKMALDLSLAFCFESTGPSTWSLIAADSAEVARVALLAIQLDASTGEYKVDEHVDLVGPAKTQASSKSHANDYHSCNPQAAQLSTLRFGQPEARTTLQTGSFRLPALCGQRFDSDYRLQEVGRLLDSSQPQFAQLGKRDGVDESKNAEISKMKGALSRIKSCSVGRGIFLLRSRRYYPTRPWRIPALRLEVHTSAGERLGPSQGLRETFDLEWPEFHNGVAAAMEMEHGSADLDSHWLFHGQGSSPNATHAGFLLGIGLLGKISSLGKVHAWRYLVNRHKLTSLAVVLGLAATYVGTRDHVAFTLLSIQLPAFLPAGAASLNIPFQTQAAGLLGIGMVFLKSYQRTKADALLREMVPPELESKDMQADFREGHALAAGFALGLVMLGRARDHPIQSEADLVLVERLTALIEGKSIDGRPVSSEGHVAVGITSTPATIALALIFLRSNRHDIAERFVIPQDAERADEVRPDLLFARSLARSLIMWQAIEPSSAWLESCVPAYMLNVHPPDHSWTPIEEAVELARLNVKMGLYFAMGLKFVGHGPRSPAMAMLLGEMAALMEATRQKETGYFGKIRMRTLNAALDVVGLAAACVAAGSGDLKLLAILRMRHHEYQLSYGNQMAVHMALGLLFLGGGRFTLSNSDHALAFLLIAMFPRFPTAPGDNRAHLQAFRHLWALAVEPKMLLAQNAATHRSEKVGVSLQGKEAEERTPIVLSAAMRSGNVEIDGKRVELGPDNAATPVVVSVSLPATVLCRQGQAAIAREPPSTFTGAMPNAYAVRGHHRGAVRFAPERLARSKCLLGDMLARHGAAHASDALVDRHHSARKIRAATTPQPAPTAAAGQLILSSLLE